MTQEYLTHKEIEFALKEINDRLDSLQNKITNFKKEFLAHRDPDDINLEWNPIKNR